MHKKSGDEIARVTGDRAIIIDGGISLELRAQAGQADHSGASSGELRQPANTDDHERIRRSRVNDVMVVIERHVAIFEQSIHTHLATYLPGTEDATVTLLLDPDAPRFEVRVERAESQMHALSLTDRNHAVQAVQTAIVETIGAYANGNGARRWQPCVEARWRNIDPSPQRNRRNIAPSANSHWLKMLLALIALTAVATAYLWLSQLSQLPQ